MLQIPEALKAYRGDISDTQEIRGLADFRVFGIIADITLSSEAPDDGELHPSY